MDQKVLGHMSQNKICSDIFQIDLTLLKHYVWDCIGEIKQEFVQVNIKSAQMSNCHFMLHK